MSVQRGAIKGLLAVGLLSWVAAAEEEERASKMAVAIAATLLGAVSFQMALFYLTNWPDADIRKYSYDIINSTVSIFSAVLLFQTVNDLVELWFMEGKSPLYRSFIDLCHMLVWYVILQLALAWISGAIGDPPQDMETMELNMKCWAVLLAHLTGFASINAWGSLQQLDFFSSSPAMSFLVLPLATAGQLILQKVTFTMRDKIALGDDGEYDEFEKKWVAESAEAENDVMGLTLSFNLTQALRFAVCGHLPDQEGQETWEEIQAHTAPQMFGLWGAGFVLVTVMIVLFMVKPEKESADEEQVEGEARKELEETEEKDKTRTTLVDFIEEDSDDDGEEEEEEEDLKEGWASFLKRLTESSIITLSMGFAWCMFFTMRMFLASMPSLDDKMLVAVVLTMIISGVSFSSIWVLDKLADADCTGDRTDRAIIQIIKAIGILVGFGWEQCFDQAVESISSALPQPHLSKMILALLCVTVIVPAWKWYLLPMAIQEGWKFGFVVDDSKEEMQEAIKMLHKKKKKKMQTDQHFLELRKMIKMEAISKDELKKRSEVLATEGALPLPLPPGRESTCIIKIDQQVQSEPEQSFQTTSLASLTTPLLNISKAPPYSVSPAVRSFSNYREHRPADASHRVNLHPKLETLHDQVSKLELLTQNFVGAFSNKDI